MEYRYVYRRVEDAIGAPLVVPNSRHAALTRALRYDYRERRDIAHGIELRALGLATMTGNANVDVFQMSDRVFDTLEQASEELMPYVGRSARPVGRKAEGMTEEAPEETSGSMPEEAGDASAYSEYADAFADLEQFKKELARSRGGAQAGTQPAGP